MSNGNNPREKNKSLESWIWDAACSIRGAKDAPKYKDYILPLIFTKRLCDVFDDTAMRDSAGPDSEGKPQDLPEGQDHLNRIATEVGSRKSRSDSGDRAAGASARLNAFALVKSDHKLVRFYLPLVPDDPEQPVWSVIRKLSDKIGEGVTTHMRAIARENPLLQGIIDRVDFNATTGQVRNQNDEGRKRHQRAHETVRAADHQAVRKSAENDRSTDSRQTTISSRNGIHCIADTLTGWKEEAKLSRIVDHAELQKNDYDISPSRYIHTSDAETYRPIAELVEELKVIAIEAKETDRALRKFLEQLGV